MITGLVSFNRAWLIDPKSPATDQISSGTVRQQDETDVIDGEVRQFAGGHKQLVVRTATLDTLPITFVAITPAQLQQLRTWKGRLLLLRTVSGDRLFGSFFQISIKARLKTSVGDGRAFDAAIVFYATDYTEVV